MNAVLHEVATAGWTVLPGLLTADELRSAILQVSRTNVPADSPFHVSNVHSTALAARDGSTLVRELLGRAVSRSIDGYESFLGAVITKGSGGGAVDLHQDWTYTDEQIHRAIVVWVPMVDTNNESGALRIVPGSHLWTTGIRPGGGRLATDSYQTDFVRLADTLDLRAGDACVYDPALLHGSWPNETARPRPAVAAAFAPSGAGLVHFDAGGSGLTGYQVDSSYFVRQPYGAKPDTPPDVLPWADAVCPEDFAPHLMEDQE